MRALGGGIDGGAGGLARCILLNLAHGRLAVVAAVGKDVGDAADDRTHRGDAGGELLFVVESLHHCGGDDEPTGADQPHL